MPATDVLATPRTDVLSNHTLSPFPLVALGEMEDEFNRNHCADLITISLAADPESWEKAMEFASEILKTRPVAFGTEAFDLRALSNSSLPLMFFLSLRVTEPKVTRTDAKALLTDENFLPVRTALLEFLGFKPRPKVQPPIQGAANPSTSETCTSSSAKPDSLPATSAG
jgi:hypothetical protein